LSQSPRAIILLSGGVDSATVLAIATREGFEVYALSFQYGQRHAVELEAARRLAKYYDVARHLVVPISSETFGDSVLTGGEQRFGGSDAPATYVPARNTLFLSHALAWSEVLGSRDVFMGANADDAAGYPDCREAYLRAFEQMAALGTQSGSSGDGQLTIRAPLLHLRKTEVVGLARSLEVPLELTWSCYFPTEERRACGKCDACRLRWDAGLD